MDHGIEAASTTISRTGVDSLRGQTMRATKETDVEGLLSVLVCRSFPVGWHFLGNKRAKPKHALNLDQWSCSHRVFFLRRVRYHRHFPVAPQVPPIWDTGALKGS